MTDDYDVLMDLPIHLFHTMQERIKEIQKLVRRFKEDMIEWGFDGRNPLKNDSFTIPKLIQFDADLGYIYEEMNNIKKERKMKGDARMTELKPCPFCGSHGDNIYLDEFWERYGEPYFVACNGCGACGPYADKKERAIELWNERVKE